MNALILQPERDEFPDSELVDPFPLDDSFLRAETDDEYDDEYEDEYGDEYDDDEARLLVMYSESVGAFDAA